MNLPYLSYKFMSILFKIQGYCLKDIRENGKRIELEVVPTMRKYCRCCLSDKRYDSRIRKIYIGSVLGSPVYAVLQVYRIKCTYCGIRTERHDDLYLGKRRYSQSVLNWMPKYTQLLDNASLSTLLGISKSMVYRIDREALSEMKEKYESEIKSCETMSLDEVAFKKGHNYATVLTNYADAKVVWIERGRTKEDTRHAFERFSDGLKETKTMVMDFWPAYVKTTEEMVPGASIVFDRFHLSRILNRKIDEERRAYQRDLPDDERKKVKKQSRWLMLKRRSNLNEESQDHLQELKKKNNLLYEIYLLKEDFLNIFEKGRPIKEATDMIVKWTKTIFSTNYKYLKSFAGTVLKKLDNILNWFKYNISNGKAEGVNNTIKTLLKRAYGYKDFEYFQAKVLQKCGYLMDYIPKIDKMGKKQDTHTF